MNIKWYRFQIGETLIVLLLLCMVQFSTERERGNGERNKNERSQVLEMIASEDLRGPPNYDSDEPVVIQCELYITSFDSVDEAKMDFTVGVILHLSWTENRILNKNVKFDYIELDSKNMEKLWVPDIFFPNEKKAAFHEVMIPNRMFRLYNNGTVSYITRITLTLSCDMKLNSYPFDKQICSIYVESFGYTYDQLVLKWTNSSDAVQLRDKVELPQFKVKGSNYSEITRFHRLRGNYSVLSCDIFLARNIGYYVIQMYIPSLLIVMLSWISFWLNVNSVPARVTLGVLSVLTISTQSSSVNASLPRVSYTKAIDIWMITCLVFVFAALIEFAVSNILSRKANGKGFIKTQIEKRFRKKNQKSEESDKNAEPIEKGSLRRREQSRDVQNNFTSKDTIVNFDGSVGIKDDDGKPKVQKGALYGMYMDVASRVLFPLAFAVFNAVYWVHFLNVMDWDNIDNVLE